MKDKHLSVWQDHLDLSFMKRCNQRGTAIGGYKHKIASEIVLNHESVLDVGAGLATISGLFSEIKYTAAEITEKYIEYMKSKNIDCVHCINAIPLEDNSYDCVISFETINHQIDYKHHLSELLRIAKNKVYVSFFKKWQEDARDGIDYLSHRGVYENNCGLIEERDVRDNKVVCIYNFINKQRLVEYLDSLNLVYKFEKYSDIESVLTISLR